MVRYGNNFSVYKSPDGVTWTGLGGSAYTVTGPIYVGFVVASGGSGTATATIDNVFLNTAPVLPFESSWIGNTLSSDASDYVSSSANAMWVAPDGTCYTGGMYDEAGEIGKVYKNGQVTKHLYWIGGPFAYEGCITSDGTHLYGWGNAGLPSVVQSDMNDSYYSMVGMTFSSPLTDSNGCWMSGLGYSSSAGQLYVSDAKAQVVRVANPAAVMPEAGGGWQHFTTAAITVNTTLDPNPAPTQVYQKNRQSNASSYYFNGLTPGTAYDIRFHFAVIDTTAKVGTYNTYMDAGTNNVSISGFDPYAVAGYNTTVSQSLHGCLSNATGQITVEMLGNFILSGIEAVNTSSGVTAQRINVGGPMIPGTPNWQSDVNETSTFPFTRPGPIAVDGSGNLWIISEAVAFNPAGPWVPSFFIPTPTNSYLTATINCVNSAGVQQSAKQINGVINPTAIFTMRLETELLVADNGPD